MRSSDHQPFVRSGLPVSRPTRRVADRIFIEQYTMAVPLLLQRPPVTLEPAPIAALGASSMICALCADYCGNPASHTCSRHIPPSTSLMIIILCSPFFASPGSINDGKEPGLSWRTRPGHAITAFATAGAKSVVAISDLAMSQHRISKLSLITNCIFGSGCKESNAFFDLSHSKNFIKPVVSTGAPLEADVVQAVRIACTAAVESLACAAALVKKLAAASARRAFFIEHFLVECRGPWATGTGNGRTLRSESRISHKNNARPV